MHTFITELMADTERDDVGQVPVPTDTPDNDGSTDQDCADVSRSIPGNPELQELCTRFAHKLRTNAVPMLRYIKLLQYKILKGETLSENEYLKYALHAESALSEEDLANLHECHVGEQVHTDQVYVNEEGLRNMQSHPLFTPQTSQDLPAQVGVVNVPLSQGKSAHVIVKKDPVCKRFLIELLLCTSLHCDVDYNGT